MEKTEAKKSRGSVPLKNNCFAGDDKLNSIWNVLYDKYTNSLISNVLNCENNTC
jgi:hypothetical protein